MVIIATLVADPTGARQLPIVTMPPRWVIDESRRSPFPCNISGRRRRNGEKSAEKGDDP